VHLDSASGKPARLGGYREDRYIAAMIDTLDTRELVKDLKA
jgi:hypothetical protein